MYYVNVNNLYNYHNKNNTLLVVSCDLITDVAVHCLADIHRSYDAMVTALFSSVPETSADRKAAINSKAKKTNTILCE